MRQIDSCQKSETRTGQQERTMSVHHKKNGQCAQQVQSKNSPTIGFNTKHNVKNSGKSRIFFITFAA